jgi:hypothetical protein
MSTRIVADLKITYDDEYYDEASVFSVWLINYQPIGDPSPSPEDTK